MLTIVFHRHEESIDKYRIYSTSNCPIYCVTTGFRGCGSIAALRDLVGFTGDAFVEDNG